MPATATPVPLAPSRLRVLVLLRLTTIIATAYLLFAEAGLSGVPWSSATLLVIAIASNVPLRWIPEELLLSNGFTAGLMLLDGVLVTGVLLSSGHFGGTFFCLYFFVLFIAGIGENVRLVAVGSIVAAVAYIVASGSGGASSWTPSTSTLMRVPFFLATATFYGYLVARVRKERTLARHEAHAAAELREAQGLLAERASQLEHQVEERLRAEAELMQANTGLQHVNEMKSEFVAMVAHELKGPLSSIGAALDILHHGRAGALPERHARFVEMARRNAQRLRRITGDLLDLSKIEAGRLEYSFGEVDLRTLCEDLVLSHAPQAEKQSLRLALDCPARLSAVVADAHRIEQVLTNLLTNAMKFTPEGGRVTVRLEPTLNGVEVSVLDSGVGLTQEQRKRVFERFYQVPEGHRERPRGTGLGLCISRELIEAHGDELSVESERGRGTRFYFRLSAAMPDQPLVSPADRLATAHP